MAPPLQQWSGKTYPLRLRSSRHFTQRRSERKENAIAALPTSIDNDYTTLIFYKNERITLRMPLHVA